MPPRIQPPSRAIRSILRTKRSPTLPRQYATISASIDASQPSTSGTPPPLPILRQITTQPPSYKPASFRKTQLLRQYASLIQSTPLMLLFQHNNLKANEWTGIRRELVQAFKKVDADLAASGVPAPDLSHTIKLQIIQTGIFAAALKIVEFYDPATAPKTEDGMTHILSKAAHEAVAKKRTSSSLDPLLSGPLVLLTFPTVSPQHLKAALQILHPSKPDFPAPTRRANPGYHELPVQSGLQKLLLMGARVEGKVFDTEGTKWVGGIQGGLDGLRAQVVYLLQSLGGSVASTLESASKSLYYTVEGRRAMLEEEEKGPVEAEGEAKKAE